MNVEVEILPNCLASLKIEVEAEKVTSTREAIVREFTQQARLPGFRPGKIPRTTIESRFKEQIREELQRKLVQESAREAIQTKGLRVLQLASVDDVELPEIDGSPAKFTATVVTQPEFELPVYKGLMVHMRNSDVTDAEIAQSIERLREQAADFDDIEEDRGVAMEDFAVVNYKGTIDGKPVDELFPKAGKPLARGEEFWIKMTEDAFFPGYCAAMVGAKPGERREFDVTVPDDFPVEGMPGKVIHYGVTLRGIKAKKLPELNDEFASTIVKGKTLAELRDVAREEIGRRKKSEGETFKRTEVMRQLLTRVECELPTSLVRSHTQQIINDIVEENTARGVAESILKDNEKDIVTSATANARDRIKGTFVLLRIAEKEEIKVAREELLGRVATIAQRANMGFEKMMKELEQRGALEQIHEEMLTAKVLDFLVANASLTTAPLLVSAS
ncbi:MAG: trigger factor [Chthoniobacteraceae bacterium]